jgi:hypothetical protein
MTGTQQLRKQLEIMRKSLRAFEDPIVEEIAGLRLMQETLKEREQHIAQTIRSNETTTLKITLDGAGVDDEAAPARFVSVLLDAIAAACNAAALDRAAQWDTPPSDPDVHAAVELFVVSFEVDDATAELSVTRRPGDVGAQLADPDSGAPLAELAMLAVLTTVQQCAVGDGPPDGAQAVAMALAPLAELLAASPVTATFELDPFVVEPLTVEVDRAGAQRLLDATAAA